jgi:hypothetical protein
MWSSSMKEYFCVEISEAMIKLSERLAKAAKPEIKEIFYRQYFPASMNVNFYKVIFFIIIYDHIIKNIFLFFSPLTIL